MPSEAQQIASRCNFPTFYCVFFCLWWDSTVYPILMFWRSACFRTFKFRFKRYGIVYGNDWTYKVSHTCLSLGGKRRWVGKFLAAVGIMRHCHTMSPRPAKKYLLNSHFDSHWKSYQTCRFNKTWSGPALVLGALDWGSLAILANDLANAWRTLELLNLTPHVPPKMATPWYGWSRITWNSLLDFKNSDTAATSLFEIWESKSLTSKVSTVASNAGKNLQTKG